MLKKIFIVVIIGVALFSSQFGCKQSTEPNAKKLEEELIANSMGELKEFLLEATERLRNYVVKFSKKGEFETTEELNKRLEDLKEKAGINYSIRYEAVDLFPVEFGEYNADKEIFQKVSLKVNLPTDPMRRINDRAAVFIKYDDSIGRMSVSKRGFTNFNVGCPREKAKILRNEIVKARCDIIFSLDFSLLPVPGANPRGLADYGGLLRFTLRDIKFYHLDSHTTGLAVPGGVIFQASGR